VVPRWFDVVPWWFDVVPRSSDVVPRWFGGPGPVHIAVHSDTVVPRSRATNRAGSRHGLRSIDPGGAPHTAHEPARARRDSRRAALDDRPDRAGSVDPRVGTAVRVLRVLGYQVVVTDPLGGLLEPVAEEDEPHDRAGRRLPAHLKTYKTPGYFDCDRGWCGWERIAWPFGPGEPPEYTYRLRRE
jgi:hypothetical protein